MSDELEGLLWVEPKVKKAESPEERVEEALRKALEATTPERPGAPWEIEEKRSEPGFRIPEYSEER